MPKKSRTLTDKEKALWEEVTATARPTKKTRAPAPEKSTRVVVKKPYVAVPELPRAQADITLERGAYANIDRNTATRVRKGKYPIDATLDLHGMTRDAADRALTRAIENAYAQGKRCLLVITGKGREGEGVLRSALPQWVASESLRPYVLAFDHATQAHGGSGAFYVFLKRRRA